MRKCARCSYPSTHGDSNEDAPCPECGMLPQQAAAWAEHKHRSARWMFAISVALPAIGISAVTAILHANAAIDVAFLSFLMIAGYVPLGVIGLVNSRRSRVCVTSYFCGASIGVYVSFWSRVRLAYEPVAGVLLVPLVMGLIGTLFVAVTWLVLVNAARGKSL